MALSSSLVSFPSVTYGIPLTEPAEGEALSEAELIAQASQMSSSQDDPELNGLVSKHIDLKVGVKVLLTRNIDMKEQQCLVNGSRGEVMGFVSSADLVQTAVDELQRFAELKARLQEDGKPCIWIDTVIAKIEKQKAALQFFTRLPRIKFQSIGHSTTHHIKTVVPNMFEVRNCEQYKFRLQLPLRLGYAATVHKSQGTSLDSTHLSNAGRPQFEYGQVYTALGRVPLGRTDLIATHSIWHICRSTGNRLFIEMISRQLHIVYDHGTGVLSK